MGCGSSAEARPYNGTHEMAKENPHEISKSNNIDRELDRAKQNEDLKVKLLLLGAGESGKSTIFKQMRILHGTPRSEDDLKMYGVVVRSNIMTAMRKLCTLLRNLGLEDQLAAEPKAEDDNGTGMTPKEAFDLLVAHIVDGTATTPLESPKSAENDWVGTSARAGLAANNDAKEFLKLWRHIKTLWEVRLVNFGVVVVLY